MTVIIFELKLYDGGTGTYFLESIVSDMSIDASKAINFTKNYNNLKTTIQNQRLSVMGVDTDEEAMDLVKFQQAYNRVIRRLINLFLC